MARVKGERKKQIAGVALEIISEGGIDALTTAELSKRVGIVPSALYRHFASMDEVVVAAIHEMVGHAGELFLKYAQGISDPREQLRVSLRIHRELLHKSKAMPHILAASTTSHGRELFRGTIKQVQDRYMAMLGAVIQSGQEQGIFLPGLDAGDAALQFFSILVMANIRHIAAGDEFDVETFKAQSYDIFIRGISNRPEETGGNHA